MNKIVLHKEDLDGYLNDDDKKDIKMVDKLYKKSLSCCEELSKDENNEKIKEELTSSASEIGSFLEGVCKKNDRIHVYCFETPNEMHGEASRLVSKLRNPETHHEEFLYYIQRAYELMFAYTFARRGIDKKRPMIQKTPVNNPVQNYAVHKIPDVDDDSHNAVMCVMLRGALLPSMIISKEFQDYSSDGTITPFALFKIKRDESKKEKNMDYVLDLDRSFFSLEGLDGKDLIFADPMNATGGSLVTIVKYLKENGVKPRSIKAINVIAALKGSIRITRAIEEAEVYTLWMDPSLNEMAYILPGLGDAGDRLNGVDKSTEPRNMIQLIADYGSSIVNLYREQVKEIEKTVLK